MDYYGLMSEAVEKNKQTNKSDLTICRGSRISKQTSRISFPSLQSLVHARVIQQLRGTTGKERSHAEKPWSWTE